MTWRDGSRDTNELGECHWKGRAGTRGGTREVWREDRVPESRIAGTEVSTWRNGQRACQIEEAGSGQAPGLVPGAKEPGGRDGH